MSKRSVVAPNSQRAPASTEPAHRAGQVARSGLILLVILAAAVIVRALYLGEISAHPDYVAPGVDAGFHQYWATALVTGDWTPPSGADGPRPNEAPFVRPPGYPYFLAGIYALFGANAFAPRVVQMLLGIFNVLAGYWIGRRWFSERVGLIWAALLAIYWSFVYFEGELHATTLVTTLYLATLGLMGRWFERRRWHTAAATGVLLGLAALATPNNLALVPVAAIAMIVHAWRRPATRRGLPSAVALLAGAAAAIAPATIRNAMVAGEFVLISTNGGVNLYIGNNPQATPHAAGYVPGFGRFHTPHDYPALVAAVQRQTGRAMGYAEIDHHFRRLAWQFIWENPGQAIGLAARKALLFWGPVEVANNKDVHYERVFSPVLRRLPGNFSSVLALAILGLVLTPGRRRTVEGAEESTVARAILRLALAFILVYFATYVPFFVAARYRVPMIAFLLLFAALGGEALFAYMQARRWRPAGVTVAAGVLLYVVVAQRYVDVAPSVARWHFDRAAAHARLREYDQALPHYREALAEYDGWPTLHVSMAVALHELGQPAEALDHLQRAFDAEGPEHVTAHRLAGRILADQRQFDAALGHYDEVLGLRPEDFAARLGKAQVLCRAGKSAEALPLLAQLAAGDRADGTVHFWLGLALREHGQLEASDHHLQQAVHLAPEYGRALVEMGLGPASDAPAGQPLQR
jgi:tetratricopeptide (TPR) repeat protein